MGRVTEKKCRLCRREGVKLFLKGSRCDTAKCALTRRDQPPGVRSWRRGKVSDYAVQLREKQKAKRFYGMYERQFRRFFRLAERAKGNTGENLVVLCERRLDNVVCRLGLACSRPDARQIIRHGHITVNGKKVDIPSYLVSPDNEIATAANDKSRNLVRSRLEMTKGRGTPSWLSVSGDTMVGRVVAMPTREEASLPLDESLIVEICSR